MRTNERTYRQHLAFDDPDRKSDLHDQACLYLMQDTKRKKLVSLFVKDHDDLVNEPSFALSAPLYKVFDSRNANIVGYTDILASFDRRAPEVGCTTTHVIIEVKAGRTSIPACIQQIQTYAMHLSQHVGNGPQNRLGRVLCTLYRINTHERDMLLDHGIRHIFVDPEHVKAFAGSHGTVEDLPF